MCRDGCLAVVLFGIPEKVHREIPIVYPGRTGAHTISSIGKLCGRPLSKEDFHSVIHSK